MKNPKVKASMEGKRNAMVNIFKERFCKVLNSIKFCENEIELYHGILAFI